MNQSNNALLPPIEWEDFQKTPLFQILEKRQDDWAEISRFLDVDILKALEYVSNPRTFFDTSYEQADFEEICDFLRDNGTLETEIPSSSDFGERFACLHTNVGRFVVYRSRHVIQGILNRKASTHSKRIG